MKIAVDDIVRLRKKHPCGGDEWRVVKIGVDIRLQCLRCGRVVLLERSILERRVKTVISGGALSTGSDNT
jgi:hypothetical protein